MKKSLLGYNISEANITLNALREENESLNAIIITMKTEMENIVSEGNTKVSLLEDELMKDKKALQNAVDEKRELLSQIAVLSEKIEALQDENEALKKIMLLGQLKNHKTLSASSPEKPLLTSVWQDIGRIRRKIAEVTNTFVKNSKSSSE